MASGVFIYGAYVVHTDIIANLRLEGEGEDVRPLDDGTYRLLYRRADDGQVESVVFDRDFEILSRDLIDEQDEA